jgi:hypothetical protein
MNPCFFRRGERVIIGVWPKEGETVSQESFGFDRDMGRGGGLVSKDSGVSFEPNFP